MHKNIFHRVRSFALGHKLISSTIVLALAYGGYRLYQSKNNASGEVRYVLGQATRTTLISSVSGSGQVSASSQVDLKPKASGDIVYLGVREGQSVAQGTTIVALDTTDAEKAVRDAEVNLASAKLALAKLQKPADTLSLTQSENTLARANDSKLQAEADLAKAYDDGFNTVANSFLDLPTIMTGLNDMLYSTTNTISTSGQTNSDFYTSAIANYDEMKAKAYQKDLATKYTVAKSAYERTAAAYKVTTRFSSPDVIATLIADDYLTTKNIAEAIKSAINLVQLYKDQLTDHNIKPIAIADTHLTSLTSYTSKTNAHLGSLLSSTNGIKDYKDALVNADRSISENTQSLEKLKAGADALDVQSAELTVKQRENALLDAKQNLADYYVRAPFAGTVAKLPMSKGDAASAGTVVATFITYQKLAEISLNEVDAAKVHPGDKATLTFDALPGVTLTGKVASLDTIGTVSQGVVTYTAKLGFDTQDTRVKTGMSVTAAIVTDVKSGVLAVPNSAVKTRGAVRYVELLTGTSTPTRARRLTGGMPPEQREVMVGISNDTLTEIISGLAEGATVVVRTISPTAAATAPSAPSLFGGSAGGSRGGNTIRVR